MSLTACGTSTTSSSETPAGAGYQTPAASTSANQTAAPTADGNATPGAQTPSTSTLTGSTSIDRPRQNATPQLSQCATPTSQVTIAANLDSSAQILELPWNPAVPFTSSNFGTALTVYDSAAGEHVLSVLFRRAGARTYDYHAFVDGESGPGIPELGAEIGSGTLAFTTYGALESATTKSVTAVSLIGIAEPQTISIDFGPPLADGGSGTTGSISVFGESAVLAEWQDGKACDTLSEDPRPCGWPMPAPTTRMAIVANLDATLADAPLIAAPWDVTNPVSTSNWAIILYVFDSLGQSHPLHLHFRRTAERSWDYHVIVNEFDGVAPSLGAVEVGAGAFTFDFAGALASMSITTPLAVSFPYATPRQPIALDFGQSPSGKGHISALPGAFSSQTASHDGTTLPAFSLLDPAICR